jgi:RimJ/RimL family protein N-acetyltransferase
MTPSVPTLETERLLLRGHRPDDLDDCVAMWSDPQVTRYISGKAAGREEVWARLLRYIGHWAVAGFGIWLVRERATGRFVGETGIADFQRDFAVPFDGAPEAAWVLAPSAHGKGYATEAMSAVLAWSDARFARTVCIISAGHTVSLRVAEKLGYHEMTRAEYKKSEVIVFERVRPSHRAGTGT